MNAGTLDAARLEAFRAILADYDIVATGIKTLLQQLPAVDSGAARVMETKLHAIEQALGLDRETLWRFQVSDDRLADLLVQLDWDASGDDPLAALSAHLVQIKRLLSPVSHAVEASLRRNHDALPELVVHDDAQQRQDNLELVAYALAFGHSHLRSTPLRFILDTTSRCNLRCLTCYQSDNQDAIHYDLADAPLGILEQAIKQARQVFVAGMGEPFLSRSAFDLIAWAKAGGAYIETITNGTTLARAARVIPDVDVFMISFDGGTPASFDTIRRYASFRKIVDGIGSLSPADRRKICFNVVVCKQNVFTLGKSLELAVSLRIGHVHLQDMQNYLTWHDKMEIGDVDRAWLFSKLPVWEGLGANSGVTVLCNLVRNQASHDVAAIDTKAATRRNLKAVAKVPAPPMPKRVSLQQAADMIDASLQAGTPDVFRSLTEAMQGLMERAAPPEGAVATVDPDWGALRRHVETGQAMFPHCLATYAHMIVNGDGTTRSCCKVQNRLGALTSHTFGALWNAPPYVELRAAHAEQGVPRAACEQCRDPVRFHFLPEILETLDARGIDVALMRKPRDFPVPSSCAGHDLVLKLGSSVGASRGP